MDPNPLQPFGAPGVPGDPMEDVLSLQTFSNEAAVPVEYEKRTGVCHLNCFVTNSCHTGQCDTIGGTNVCNTIECSYGSKDASVEFGEF